MEISGLNSKVKATSVISVVSIVVSVVFFIGVVTSLRFGRHHHCLMLIVAIGLLGATLAQGLGDSVREQYPRFIHILYHVSLDGLASPALAGTSMTRLFICLQTTPDISTAKVYQIFSLTLVLIVGAVRLCIQSTTLGLQHHHRSTVLFCDGLIAFWDLGCCLLVLCAYLTRNLSSASPISDDCSNCNIKDKSRHSLLEDDGFLVSNITSVVIRGVLVVVTGTNGNTLWDMISLGIIIPIIIVVDLRRKTIQAFRRFCCFSICKRRRRSLSRSGFASEDFCTHATDVASVVLELSDLDQSRDNLQRNSSEIPSLSSIIPNNSDENEQFLVPRSKSEHSGIVANRRSALGTILSVSPGPTRSCSCGSFNCKTRSSGGRGPLDQVLSQVVGEKMLDSSIIREDKLEDDGQQMDKLKASLSIQAICSIQSSSAERDLNR